VYCSVHSSRVPSPSGAKMTVRSAAHRTTPSSLAAAGTEIQAVRLTSGVAWLTEPLATQLRFCERGKDLRRRHAEPNGMGEGTAKWRRHGVSLSSAPREADDRPTYAVTRQRARRSGFLDQQQLHLDPPVAGLASAVDDRRRTGIGEAAANTQ